MVSDGHISEPGAPESSCGTPPTETHGLLRDESSAEHWAMFGQLTRIGAWLQIALLLPVHAQSTLANVDPLLYADPISPTTRLKFYTVLG